MERPLCKKCGLREVAKKSKNTYRQVCGKCHSSKPRDNAKVKRNARLKLEARLTCYICGFVALHPAQLDIDHIDGNRRNENNDNLQVICANCHRLKTVLWEEYKHKA